MDRLIFVAGPETLPPEAAAQLGTCGFNGALGQMQRLTQSDGTVQIYAGLGTGDQDFWLGAKACQKAKGLTQVHVANPEALDAAARQDFALSWLLESYRYGAFKETRPAAQLQGLEVSEATRARAASLGLVRDLINTPANHMRPGDLARKACDLAQAQGAVVHVLSGEALAAGFPLVQAVGGAAGQGAMAPRLIDLRWGETGPALTLVGKGITFDSGGLNLKPGQSMALMKKDMGGAAHALGLAQAIMVLGLPIRLRVLIPTAENSLGAGAFRPGDIVSSRSGFTVEIDNTDAEGRLILADALTYAQEEEQPDLLLTLATLTSAARVAVGPTVAPYFANDSDLIWQILAASDAKVDPLWPLPLFAPYDSYLASDVADLVNSGGTGFAGAITAALFLKRFVRTNMWAHFDVYGWNPEAKPGRPKGGAAQGLISLLTYLENWACG